MGNDHFTSHDAYFLSAIACLFFEFFFVDEQSMFSPVWSLCSVVFSGIPAGRGRRTGSGPEAPAGGRIRVAITIEGSVTGRLLSDAVQHCDRIIFVLLVVQCIIDYRFI